MEFWLIATIVSIWVLLSAFILVTACMLSSRLSRGEENQYGRAGEEFVGHQWVKEREHALKNPACGRDLIELPAK